MASNPITKVTTEEYLELDRAAEFRSEFLDGEIVAMSGGSRRHSTVVVNLTGEIRTALRGTSCRAFESNLRIRVSPSMYTYPDLTVVCGQPMPGDDREDILTNPTVIFEVLSPSTERYDRGVKLRRYREIPTLTDYILVDQDQIRIEQFTRGVSNSWTLRDYQQASDVLLIASIGVSLPLSSIYEQVGF